TGEASNPVAWKAIVWRMSELPWVGASVRPMGRAAPSTATRARSRAPILTHRPTPGPLLVPAGHVQPERLLAALSDRPWPAVASSLDAAAYRDAVGRVRELIRDGDCYQVNLCQRLTSAWREPPLALARGLWAAAGPSSHRAYLGLPEGAVVSASPERLVSL